MSQQVLPTPISRARDFAQQLHGVHGALAAFERELRARPAPTIRERFWPYHVAVAMDHLAAALDALEFVGTQERVDTARAPRTPHDRRVN
jgi:hypothetical protein